MRHVLGPKFSLAKTPPTEQAPGGKADPAITHKGDDGVNATFTVPAYDLATSNRLMEVRLYLVPDGDPAIPADAPGYIASAFPFGHADVSGFQGGDTTVAVPATDALVSLAQYVLGYEA